MYVRALSTEHREADWVQRFVTLAATDPGYTLLCTLLSCTCLSLRMLWVNVQAR